MFFCIENLQVNSTSKNDSKNFIFFLILGSLMIFCLLRTFPFYEQISAAFDLPNMTKSLKLGVLIEYGFSTFPFAGFIEQFLQISLSIFTTLNILLFMVFAKQQQRFLKHQSFWGGLSGMFLGVFGVGCISCGAFVLAPIITFLGFSSYLHFFAMHATQISFIGVFLVIISCLFVLKKLSSPTSCKISE